MASTRPTGPRRGRALILDSNHRVIAASDVQGLHSEVMNLPALKESIRQLRSRDGTLLGCVKPPGYETYRGMGWTGVITLRPAPPAVA